MNRETIVSKINPLIDEFMMPLETLSPVHLIAMRAALTSLCVMCHLQGQLYELDQQATKLQARIDDVEKE